MKNPVRRVYRTWNWFRFGKVKATIQATAGHNVASEIEYTDRFGRVVGYWAYGQFDPKMPYQG